MTPLELTANFLPFVVCWFFIWMTNVSERPRADDLTKQKRWDTEVHPHHHHQTNKYHTRKHHEPSKDDPLLWNVSSFLSLKRSAM